MFPSLPMSILYGTVITTLFDNVFRFAVIIECLILKFSEFIFIVSMQFPFSWSGSCSILWTTLPLVLLKPSQKWFIMLHFAHFFPSAGHLLGSWLDPQYLQFCIMGILTCVCNFLPFCFCSSLTVCICQILSSNPGC